MPPAQAGRQEPPRPDDKVRRLQRRLWVAAKQQPGRRFHALYDRIWRSDVLREARKRPLGIPTVRDRVVQAAAKLVLERVRASVKELTARSHVGRHLPDLLRQINPILRGWGCYFRTGNAAVKFGQVDDYVVERLRGLMVKRKGRNLGAGEAGRWNRDYFEAFGLHRLRGTVQYPGAAA